MPTNTYMAVSPTDSILAYKASLDDFVAETLKSMTLPDTRYSVYENGLLVGVWCNQGWVNRG